MDAKMVTEISFYSENEPGVLGKTVQRLADAGINIFGVHIYEGQLESLTRLVVDQDKIEQAEKLLRDLGIDMISQHEILELICTGKVGMLAKIAKTLGKHGINIKILYFTEGPTKETVVYLTPSDVPKALEVFREELSEL